MATKVVHGKRTDISVVKEWATSLNGELLSLVYENMLSRLEWKCSLGHRFMTTFNHVKNRGQWCPICGKEKSHKVLLERMKDPKIREKIAKGHWRRNGISSNEQRLSKRAENKKKRYLYRLKTDTQERLKHNIRQRVRMAINGTKSQSVTKNLGCSWNDLKTHLESLFVAGMTWDNYGRTGWHIDHIKPLSFFNLSDNKEFQKACHYTNLQPLWAKDNLVS